MAEEKGMIGEVMPGKSGQSEVWYGEVNDDVVK